MVCVENSSAKIHSNNGPGVRNPSIMTVSRFFFFFLTLICEAQFTAKASRFKPANKKLFSDDFSTMDS